MDFPNHRSLVGVISGMIVWAVWFAAVYALQGVGCEVGWHHHAVPGGNALSVSMLASAVLALVLIGGCARRGYSGWRADTAASGGVEAAQRLRFMGLVMFVLSLLAVAGTLLVALPILMLDPCAT
jgi:hypothetical protein